MSELVTTVNITKLNVRHEQQRTVRTARTAGFSFRPRKTRAGKEKHARRSGYGGTRERHYYNTIIALRARAARRRRESKTFLNGPATREYRRIFALPNYDRAPRPAASWTDKTIRIRTQLHAIIISFFFSSTYRCAVELIFVN